jgi:hypothetical protein
MAFLFCDRWRSLWPQFGHLWTVVELITDEFGSAIDAQRMIDN